MRKLPEDQLIDLASEVREFLLDSISQVGGHFASGLGTVELTIALHYLFNTPEDRISLGCRPSSLSAQNFDRAKRSTAHHPAARRVSPPSIPIAPLKLVIPALL